MFSSTEVIFSTQLNCKNGDDFGLYQHSPTNLRHSLGDKMGKGTSQQAAWIPACFGKEIEFNSIDKPAGFSARCFNLLA